MDWFGAVALLAKGAAGLITAFALCVAAGVWAQQGSGETLVDASQPFFRRYASAALALALTGLAVFATIGLICTPIAVLRLTGQSWSFAIGTGVPLGVMVLLAVAWYLFEVRGAGRLLPPPN